MAKKKKKKGAAIFPPETGENRLPSPALQSPANAVAASASFAGLGSVGSINEEVQKLFPEQTKEELEKIMEEWRNLVWENICNQLA